MGYRLETVQVQTTSVRCSAGRWRCGGWSFEGGKMPSPEALAWVGRPCKARGNREHCDGTMELVTEVVEHTIKHMVCGGCGDEKDADQRYSFGVYCGIWCSKCVKARYRDHADPTATFDEMDAGERMEPEDY